MSQTKFWPHYIITGIIAGTMDITAACTQFFLKTDKNPVLVLQYVASAAFGRETAYSGSIIYPVLGLLFHYSIAFSWTLLFYLSYPKINLLRMNKFAVGVGYGIFVWTCMNRIVVPLSRIPSSPLVLNNAIQAALILIVCIGLPISLRAHSFYENKV